MRCKSRTAFGLGVVICALALLPVAPAAADFGFIAAIGSPFAAGGHPDSVAIGDLNGDGHPDLATANAVSGDVTVLLGDGRGGFTAAPGSPFPVGGDDPTSVAIGDLDGDGHPDLATANRGSADVTVLLDEGAGGFTAAPGSPFPAGGDAPTSVAIGDLDGDGSPDLVTANQLSDDITVLLGDGAGDFTAAPGSPFGVGEAPLSVAIGDLNGDGHPDLATANRGSADVTALLGDGEGGFSEGPGSRFAVGKGPSSLAIGDLDGDAHPDLAITMELSDDITVLLGDGAGGFGEAPGPSPGVGEAPLSVAIGDLNDDGHPDLATANRGSADVTALLGDGAGGFSEAPGSPFPVGGDEPESVAIGDLDGDGSPDLVTADGVSGDATVLLNASTPAHRVFGPLDFGPQALGGVSAARSVTVRSTGDAALRVSRVAVEGPGAGDFLLGRDTCTAGPLPVGSSCTVRVRFAPGATGAATARLVVADDSPEGTAVVPLAGTGVAPGPTAQGGPPAPPVPPAPRATPTIPTVTKIHRGTVRVPRSGRIAIARVGCPAAACALSGLGGRVKVGVGTRAGARAHPHPPTRLRDGLRFAARTGHRHRRHANRTYRAKVIAPRRIAAGSSAKLTLVVPPKARRHLLRHRKSGRASLSLVVTTADGARLTRTAVAVGLSR